ncbi:DUF4215 domain-containing protein [Nannocystis pusilla]|uniref:DUF4215 domain-containing protein n=1 Tax=Nannocystis pusilla TaxID=889268 RepID=UPI003B774BAF
MKIRPTHSLRAGLLAAGLQLAAPGCDSALDVAVDINVSSAGTAGSACGDDQIDPGEQCDDGPLNGPGKACLADCQTNVCGDGDIGPGEQCDDGDDNGPDAPCTDQCQPAACGDGFVGPGEQCDDGNAIDTDLAPPPVSPPPAATASTSPPPANNATTARPTARTPRVAAIA